MAIPKFERFFRKAASLEDRSSRPPVTRAAHLAGQHNERAETEAQGRAIAP
jgi:hypothetical protein